MAKVNVCVSYSVHLSLDYKEDRNWEQKKHLIFRFLSRSFYDG